MQKLKLLLRIAYLASASVFVLGATCVVGFLLRWTGASWLTDLSSNAGNIGFAAVVAGGICYVTMLKARNLALDLSEQQKAAKAAPGAEPSTDDAEAPKS
jgi:hypothetical protein